MATLSDVIGQVAVLLAGEKPTDMHDNVLAGELRLPIEMAQAEVQRRLRIAGVQQVQITVEGTYTANETTLDNESGTIRPTEMWEKSTTAADTEFRRMLESHESQLDFLPATDRLTVWRFDGGLVKVRPCTSNRSYRQRGTMVTNGVTFPWSDMVIGGASTPNEIWHSVYHLAAAEWLLSRGKRDLASDRLKTADRLIEQIQGESARLKQSRPVRRRGYYSI